MEKLLFQKINVSSDFKHIIRLQSLLSEYDRENSHLNQQVKDLLLENKELKIDNMKTQILCGYGSSEKYHVRSNNHIGNTLADRITLKSRKGKEISSKIQDPEASTEKKSTEVKKEAYLADDEVGSNVFSFGIETNRSTVENGHGKGIKFASIHQSTPQSSPQPPSQPTPQSPSQLKKEKGEQGTLLKKSSVQYHRSRTQNTGTQTAAVSVKKQNIELPQCRLSSNVFNFHESRRTQVVEVEHLAISPPKQKRALSSLDVFSPPQSVEPQKQSIRNVGGRSRQIIRIIPPRSNQKIKNDEIRLNSQQRDRNSRDRPRRFIEVVSRKELNFPY